MIKLPKSKFQKENQTDLQGCTNVKNLDLGDFAI